MNENNNAGQHFMYLIHPASFVSNSCKLPPRRDIQIEYNSSLSGPVGTLYILIGVNRFFHAHHAA